MPDVALIDRIIRNRYIDTRVIVRTNDAKPLMLGTLRDFDDDGDPVVEDTDGKRCAVTGIVLPYSPWVVTWLNTLNPEQQWSLLSNMVTAVKDFDWMQHLKWKELVPV